MDATSGHRSSSLAAALLAASLLWPAPAAADAGGASLSYRVYVGGILAVETDATLRLDPHGYDLEVASGTRGMLDWLLGWTNRMVTRGRLTEAGPRPWLHREQGALRGRSRSVVLDYRPGGTVEAMLEPPPEADDRDPVTAGQRQGTEDILTSVVAMAVGLGQGSGCGGERRIFDGRRRFDAVVVDRGLEDLAPTERGIFTGTARLCAVTIRRIAGYARRVSEMDHPDYRDRPLLVWVAPVAGSLPVPVRMEAESGLGGIVIHLTGAAPLLEPPRRDRTALD